MMPRVIAILFLTMMAVVASVPSATAQIIDDFESYADLPELLGAWSFATDLDTVTSNPSDGTRSLRRESSGLNPGQGAFVFRDFAEPLDLTGGFLRIWVRRDPASLTPTGFNLSARDGDGQSCALPNYVDVSDAAWHAIELDPVAHCSFVNVADIVTVSVNFSNTSSGVGDILVNIDDLAVAPLFEDGFESADTALWSSVVR